MTCYRCTWDEATGTLVDQCDACKREQASEDGTLTIGDELHFVRVTEFERVVDICTNIACNGKVYVA